MEQGKSVGRARCWRWNAIGRSIACASRGNSWPPVYPVLADQAARADAFGESVQALQDIPWIVGAHWFAWVDQPAEGRFDGENNNWGLVDIQDDAYTALTERAALVLPEVYGRLRRPSD